MTTDINLKKEAIYNFVGQLISILISGVATIYLVRTLTQYEYGLYSKIFFLCIITSQILKINFENGLFYFYHRFREKKSHYVVNTYIVLFFLSILVIIFGLIIFKLIRIHINAELSKIFIPLILLISLNIIQGTFDKLFVIENKAKWSMYYRIIFSLLRTSLIMIALIKFPILYMIIITILIVEIIKSIFALTYIKRTYDFNFAKFDKNIVLKMLKYNIWVAASWIMGRLGQSLDRIILMMLVSTSDFAIYTIGCIQLPLLSIFYNSVGDVALTKISLLSSKDSNNNTIINLYKKMFLINAMFTFPIICYSYFHIEIIYSILFKNQYTDSTGIFIITNFTTLIQMTGFGYIIRGYGKTRPLFISNLARLIFGIILGYTLIKHFGIIGGAFSYTIVFFINGIILLFYSLRIIKTSIKTIIPWKNLLLIILISFTALITVYPLKYFIIDLIYYIPISAILYTCIIIFLYIYIDLISIYNIKKQLLIKL